MTMADWDEDEFMRQWDSKYVSTNVKPGSRPYSKEFFLGLNSELVSQQPGMQELAYTLIVCPIYWIFRIAYILCSG